MILYPEEEVNLGMCEDCYDKYLAAAEKEDEGMNEGEEITFEVTHDIYWDDWGHFRRVFCKGDICKGVLHPSGEVSAESPYYEGISDYVDLDCIKILP